MSAKKYYKFNIMEDKILNDLLKNYLINYTAGDNQAYIDGCHDDFYGKIFEWSNSWR